MNQISTASPNTSSAKPLRGKIAFIRASWHRDIVDQARLGFVAEMKNCTISEDSIEIFDVPGAYEIPLLAKRLAKTGNYDAIVAAALVVDGGIYAHQFVAAAVVSGMMQVQLEVDVPIFSVVLTPQHFDESPERQKFFFDHFVTKGKEAAQACIMVLHANSSALA